MFGPSKLRIRVFRDKTDQGLTADYRAAFEKQILTCPSFLLLGSKASCGSPHVLKECEFFLTTARDTINLGLVGESAEGAFPSIVVERFPRASYADLRSRTTSNFMQWWLFGRRLFRDEMLRVVASVLAQKSGIPLSYESLRRRERQRRLRRVISAWGVVAALLVGLLVYYATTEPYGLHYTEVGRTEVEKAVPSLKADGVVALFAASENSMFWSDDAGHEGTDVAVTIHAIDSQGIVKGRLKFTQQAEWDNNTDPQRSGIFESMTSDEVSNILSRLQYLNSQTESNPATQDFRWKPECEVGEGHQTLKHQFDGQRAFEVCGNDHTPPARVHYTDNGGATWSEVATFGFHLKNASVWSAAGAGGVAFVGTPEEVDPYYPSSGGLFVTRDYGRTWTSVPGLGGWNALQVIAFNPRLPSYIVAAVGVPRRSGDATGAGLWLTRNGGVNWEAAGFQGATVEVSALHLTDTSDFLAVANGRIVIYRRRSVLDRLLQRHGVTFR
jgi:hypothetical protein